MQTYNYLSQWTAFISENMILREKVTKTDTRTQWASEASIMMPTNILLKQEADQAPDTHFYKKMDKICKARSEFYNPLEQE